MQLTDISAFKSIQKFNYHLNDEKPMVAFYHKHLDQDSWFDMHYEIELGIVCDGQMQRVYGGDTFVFDRGQIWLHPMWEPHGFTVTQLPCEVLVFEIHPAFLSEKQFNYNWLKPFQSNPAARPKINNSVARDNVLELAKQIRKRLETNAVSQLWLHTACFHLLSILIEGWQPADQNGNQTNSQAIQPALNLVFSERRLISQNEASQACGLSVRNFSRRFTDLMGISFSKFALQYRIRGAINDIKNSDKTVEAVAMDWGFTDASHLSRYLRK